MRKWLAERRQHEGSIDPRGEPMNVIVTDNEVSVIDVSTKTAILRFAHDGEPWEASHNVPQNWTPYAHMDLDWITMPDGSMYRTENLRSVTFKTEEEGE